MDPWNQAVFPELQTVREIVAFTNSEIQHPEMRAMLEYSTTNIGKMFRSSLFFMFYKMGDKVITEKITNIGASIELIHLVTLIHDDINDKSEYRHGKRSLHVAYSIPKAIAVGDFLLAKAFQLSCDVPNDVISLNSAIAEKITVGEFKQEDQLHNMDTTLDDYYDIIGNKTASFFSSCCKAGAQLWADNEELVNDAAMFGYHYGLAFQIEDDIIDITAAINDSGKDNLRDLNLGNYTIPIIMALNTESGDELSNLLSSGAGPEIIAKKVLETDSISKCRTLLEEEREMCISSLNRFEDSEYKIGLKALVDSLGTRMK